MSKSRIITALMVAFIFIISGGLAIKNIGQAKTQPTAEKTETTATEKTTAEKTEFQYTADFYNDLAEKNELLKVYNSAELTEKTLTERNGKLIIEKVYGVVIDDEGNGRILLNDNDFKQAHNRDYDSLKNNYYISYKGTEKANKGDIILSYMIYNPDSNYTDDIIERFDYIVDDKE